MTPEDTQQLRLLKKMLDINEDMYAKLPELFKCAHELQEGKEIARSELESRLAQVNYFILHCAILSAVISSLRIKKSLTDLNEVPEILKILENIQQIFLKTLDLGIN